MRFPFILLTLTIIFSMGAGFAEQSQPLYDFGTMQQGSSTQAEPGGNATFSLFFFVDSEYGNRITHISVSAEEVPEGWTVELDPPLHTEYLNVSGIVTASSENIYVEPRPVLSSIPENPEDGIYYLASPSGLGYLQAKRVEVRIGIPESAQLGQTYTIKVTAHAAWFGQSGNIALEQSRPFRYTVQLARQEYSEQLLGNTTAAQAEETQAVEAAPIDTNTYLLAALAIVIIALVGYILFSKRKTG
jgi:hypothetical protein